VSKTGNNKLTFLVIFKLTFLVKIILTILSLKTIYPIVKKILLYLYNQGYMIKNFSAMIQKPLYLKSFNPSIISKDDELKLIAYLDKISYRDQAIMLLAIRYGLRDSDICNLKFDEID